MNVQLTVNMVLLEQASYQDYKVKGAVSQSLNVVVYVESIVSPFISKGIPSV